eukprot:TRINITY_DN40501_c0_g1_i1.p2 TRINITY_DN40501_c0_g1~~TRINITY_DN40501_c0_g1_i1.p2  ORF type:complete len:425 (+),score=121.53 TRINITY_DN40501_c0_g1_i1:72-1277(+)
MPPLPGSASPLRVAAEEAPPPPLPAAATAALRTPCLVLHLEVARRNAERMLRRAAALGCALRPHVKTHKTLEGAELQTGGTRRRITVSTLAEGAFFARGGFDDILYAVPITADKLADAAALTRLRDFHVMVDCKEQLDALLARPPPAPDRPWSVFLMVDCGYHRDGVEPSDPAAIELARRISAAPSARFAGLYTHGGHSYSASGVAEIQRYAEEERAAVAQLGRRLAAAGIAVPTCGVGSTPTCSHPPPAGLPGVNEMHPGNYFAYDAMQVRIGACTAADCATRVLTRVIGAYPQRQMLLVDLGWTGCSAQGAEHGYGLVASHPELRIRQLKQEAGEVVSADGSPLDFARYPVGTVLEVIPWHACAAAALHPKVRVVRGGSVAAEWAPCRGWEAEGVGSRL